MWIGAPRGASATTAASSSGVTARRLCGATPRFQSAVRGIAGERRDEARIRVERVHEPPLARGGRRAAESGVRVEDRQQRERDAGRRGGGDDPARELRRIGVGLALRIVMHVVEFGDRRVAGLQHLDIRLRGDRLERVGVDPVEKRVHRLPPRPEAVAVRARAPGAPGDRALERVRMQVRHSRQQRAGHAFRAVGLARGRDRAIVPSAAMSIATSRFQPSGVSASAAKSLMEYFGCDWIATQRAPASAPSGPDRERRRRRRSRRSASTRAHDPLEPIGAIVATAHSCAPVAA